jgi:hypothetical protein
MSDNLTCPACGTKLREDARFCDKCGASVAVDAVVAEAEAALLDEPGLLGEEPQEVVPRRRSGVNWGGLITLGVLVLAIVWLLMVPRQAANKGGAGGMGQAGADNASANPHGDQSGMQGLQDSFASAKAALEKDPLDLDALTTLYQNYGMIGRAAQLRPYLDQALATLEQRRGELGDKFLDTGMNLGLAALMGNELDGGLAVYRKLNELEPGRPEVLSMLGDISAAQEQFADAVRYYDEYLARPGLERNDQYWNTVLFRGIAQRLRYENAAPGEADAVWLAEAVRGLEQAAAVLPELYAPQYNLGLAYGLAGEQDKALACYAKALPLAGDAIEKWQVEAEVAKLKGEAPPPEPVMDSPHGMAGAANPHAGVGGE